MVKSWDCPKGTKLQHQEFIKAPLLGSPKAHQTDDIEQAADQRPLPPALPLQSLLNTGPLHPLCLPR